MKECILIVNHDTGEYRLEKLNSNIAVKKTRWVENRKIKLSTSTRDNNGLSLCIRLYVYNMYYIWRETRTSFNFNSLTFLKLDISFYSVLTQTFCMSLLALLVYSQG